VVEVRRRILSAAVLGSESTRDEKKRSVAVICPLPQSGIVAMRPTSILLKSGRSAWKGASRIHRNALAELKRRV